ncbi:MAG: phenylacetate--CoA ligase family protein [Clostridia bacterium]|nr:MAG: phenylacetate--CoA ligase family protein [Clostridia bacterium]
MAIAKDIYVQHQPEVKRYYYNPAVECISREELLALQWLKLKKLVEHVYHTNKFYRNLFTKNKITPEDIQSLEDYRHKVPIITKQDLLNDQNEYPPYGLRLGIPETKVVHTHMTSGTSGIGQEVYGLTRPDVEYLATWPRAWYAAGIRRGDVVVNPFPMNPVLAAPDSLISGFAKMGVNGFHLGMYPTHQKLDIMRRFKPHFMDISPVYLTRMTVICQEMGIDPKKDYCFKAILTMVGSFEVDWALEMQEFWGCKLHEGYGSTQAGSLMGYTCENGSVPNGQRGRIHLMEDIILFEVLDRETREPVKSGEEGEVVLTTLSRSGSPLLRFAMDDKVRYFSYKECDCGRPFDTIECGTIARYDDMIKIRGMNVWPQAVDSVIFGHKETSEYQGRVYVTEDGREEVLVQVEFKQGIGDQVKGDLINRMAVELKEKVGVSMTLEEAKEELPKFEFKAVRWTDERLKGRQKIAWRL